MMRWRLDGGDPPDASRLARARVSRDGAGAGSPDEGGKVTRRSRVAIAAAAAIVLAVTVGVALAAVPGYKGLEGNAPASYLPCITC